MRKHGRKIALKYAARAASAGRAGRFLTKPRGLVKRVLEDMPERLARSEAVATRARALAVTVPPSSRDTVIATAWLYGGAVGLRCDQSDVSASSFPRTTLPVWKALGLKCASIPTSADGGVSRSYGAPALRLTSLSTAVAMSWTSLECHCLCASRFAASA